jgi:iron complex transport system permease protein
MRNISIIFEKKFLLLFYLIVFFLLTLLISAISLSKGVIEIPVSEVFSILFTSRFSQTINESVIFDIRLPRILLSFFVGLALSISGAVMQGIFRNPLADPSILGVSAGSALGAVIPIAFAIHTFHLLVIPMFSFIGGLLSSITVYVVFVSTGRKSNSILLLAGIAIGSFLNALITLSVYLSDNPFQMRSIFYWLIGGFESTRWEHLYISIPIISISLLFLLYKSKEINLIMIGDEYASSLGINVNRTLLLCLLFTSLVTSAAVSVSGILAFVGLVIPHLVRLMIGNDNRLVLPLSAIVGGFFVVLMDFITRIIFSSTDLRVGVLMSLIGGPFFIFLIFKNNLGKKGNF